MASNFAHFGYGKKVSNFAHVTSVMGVKRANLLTLVVVRWWSLLLTLFVGWRWASLATSAEWRRRVILLTSEFGLWGRWANLNTYWAFRNLQTMYMIFYCFLSTGSLICYKWIRKCAHFETIFHSSNCHFAHLVAKI